MVVDWLDGGCWLICCLVGWLTDWLDDKLFGWWMVGCRLFG